MLNAVISFVQEYRAEQAVAAAQQAGIQPIMITGDHPATARAIAARLGILDDRQVRTGAELAREDPAHLAEHVAEIAVYVRTTPEQKLDIIEAWKARGQVVAMTGDGVNDAPALRRADIGVAMGRNGTEVSKEAADMVLADDNFVTIVRAVREGRRIYDNIRAPAATPTRREHLRPRAVAARAGHGAAHRRRQPGLGVWGSATGRPWQTMIFTSLALLQLGSALAVRSERDSVFRMGLGTNPFLGWTVLGTLLLQLAIIYWPPARATLDLQPLTLGDLAIVLVASTATFWAIEVEKLALRLRAPMGRSVVRNVAETDAGHTGT